MAEKLVKWLAICQIFLLYNLFLLMISYEIYNQFVKDFPCQTFEL